jgi:hypothetical protein
VVTVNLDEVALKLCTGPIGQFYSRIKRTLEKYQDGPVAAAIALQLIGTGSVIVETGIKHIAGQENSKTGAGTTGKFELDLKCSASINITVIVSVSASAQAGVKTGFTAEAFINTGNGRIDIEFSASFLGVKYYYDVKVNGAIAKKTKGKKGSGTSAGGGGSASLISGEKDIYVPNDPVFFKHIFTI